MENSTNDTDLRLVLSRRGIPSQQEIVKSSLDSLKELKKVGGCNGLDKGHIKKELWESLLKRYPKENSFDLLDNLVQVKEIAAIIEEISLAKPKLEGAQ